MDQKPSDPISGADPVTSQEEAQLIFAAARRLDPGEDDINLAMLVATQPEPLRGLERPAERELGAIDRSADAFSPQLAPPTLSSPDPAVPDKAGDGLWREPSVRHTAAQKIARLRRRLDELDQEAPTR